MLRCFVLIGVLAWSQLSFAQSIFKGPSQPIANRTRSGKTPETPPFGLSDFRVVAGTSYLVAAIANHGERRIDLARRKIISNKPLPNFGTR